MTIFIYGPGRKQASIDLSHLRGTEKFPDPHPFHTVFIDEHFFMLRSVPASCKEAGSFWGIFSPLWGVIIAQTLVMKGSICSTPLYEGLPFHFWKLNIYFPFMTICFNSQTTQQKIIPHFCTLGAEQSLSKAALTTILTWIPCLFI